MLPMPMQAMVIFEPGATMPLRPKTFDGRIIGAPMAPTAARPAFFRKSRRGWMGAASSGFSCVADSL